MLTLSSRDSALLRELKTQPRAAHQLRLIGFTQSFLNTAAQRGLIVKTKGTYRPTPAALQSLRPT